MLTVVHHIPEMSLADFADQHSLTLVVKERILPLDGRDRYYAQCEPLCEIMRNSCLEAAYGSGDTPEAAAADYARRLSCTRIAIRAFHPDRREIDVPRLTHAGGIIPCPTLKDLTGEPVSREQTR